MRGQVQMHRHRPVQLHRCRMLRLRQQVNASRLPLFNETLFPAHGPNQPVS
ncbi:unnamed protein product [Laminaria digitata]